MSSEWQPSGTITLTESVGILTILYFTVTSKRDRGEIAEAHYKSKWHLKQTAHSHTAGKQNT